MVVHVVKGIEMGVDETDTVVETSARPVPVYLVLESIRLQKDYLSNIQGMKGAIV